MVALGHVWMAPCWQGLFSRLQRWWCRCSHVFGLLVRHTRPLAIMPSADQVPIKSSHSTMLRCTRPMSPKGRYRLIEAVGDESASASFSPKLMHCSEPPTSLHRKLRANLAKHDSKIWRGHGQVDVEVGAHSENR